MQPCWPQPGRDRDRFCKDLPSPIPACTNGSFGEDCAKKCQCQNGAACDPAQGTCTCPPGFTGDTCVQGKLGRPLSQPGGTTTQGTSRVWPGGVWRGPFPSARLCTYLGPILSVQREALPPRPPPISSHLPSAECPLGWHGPGCQKPCECEHQCPCDPQTGSCNLTRAPILSSILSQGTVPSKPPGSRRGQIHTLPALQPHPGVLQQSSVSHHLKSPCRRENSPFSPGRCSGRTWGRGGRHSFCSGTGRD